jgi:NADH:ubiquinone oxidoreductase subunit 6 (subunit J)
MSPFDWLCLCSIFVIVNVGSCLLAAVFVVMVQGVQQKRIRRQGEQRERQGFELV